MNWDMCPTVYAAVFHRAQSCTDALAAMKAAASESSGGHGTEATALVLESDALDGGGAQVTEVRNSMGERPAPEETVDHNTAEKMVGHNTVAVPYETVDHNTAEEMVGRNVVAVPQEMVDHNTVAPEETVDHNVAEEMVECNMVATEEAVEKNMAALRISPDQEPNDAA